MLCPMRAVPRMGAQARSYDEMERKVEGIGAEAMNRPREQTRLRHTVLVQPFAQRVAADAELLSRLGARHLTGEHPCPHRTLTTSTSPARKHPSSS